MTNLKPWQWLLVPLVWWVSYMIWVLFIGGLVSLIAWDISYITNNVFFWDSPSNAPLRFICSGMAFLSILAYTVDCSNDNDIKDKVKQAIAQFKYTENYRAVFDFLSMEDDYFVKRHILSELIEEKRKVYNIPATPRNYIMEPDTFSSLQDEYRELCIQVIERKSK